MDRALHGEGAGYFLKDFGSFDFDRRDSLQHIGLHQVTVWIREGFAAPQEKLLKRGRQGGKMAL